MYRAPCLTDWRDLPLVDGGDVENGDVKLDTFCIPYSDNRTVFAYFIKEEVD